MLSKTPFGRWIYRITNLLCRYSCRLYIKEGLEPIDFNQRLEDKLRHRGAADIAVTNEQYLFHIYAKMAKISLPDKKRG
jgi:hypothetical protein